MLMPWFSISVKERVMPDPLNLAEYELRARELLPQMVYDYYAGGANDEITVRENVHSWAQLRLRPRVLVDVRACDLSTTILGQAVAMPLITAPCALNALAHPEGELAVARATSTAGIIQVLSTVSAYSIEDVALASTGQRWFQLYCYRDRTITAELVRRAEVAGFSALCVTVDVPVPGPRERDARNQFKVPPHIRVANLTHLLPDSADGSAPGTGRSRDLTAFLYQRDRGYCRKARKVKLNVAKGNLRREY